MPDFTILLPPARQKEPGGNPFAPDMFDYRSSNTFNFFSDLNPERRELITMIQELMDEADDGELEKVFDVRDEELDEVRKINQEILDSPLMSALDRFRPGLLYEAMDFPNLPTGAQRRMLENGVIFSGLFGLLRPDDLIPNYAVPLSASLPETGPVTEYWHSHVTPLLNRALEDQLVWDFSDETCKKMWEDEKTYKKIVQISFYREEDDGERRPVTEDLEQLRGELIGFIVDDAADEVEDLNDWEHPEHFQVDFEASEYDEETKLHSLVMVPMEKEEPEEEEEVEE
jgi:cytoplasmic iron level regulating protein YaaA (DUF328/UPF0246 family)